METYFETRTSWGDSRLIVCLENAIQITVGQTIQAPKAALEICSGILAYPNFQQVDLLESSLKEQSACQISPPFPASELFAPKLLQDEDVVGNSSVAFAQSEHIVLDTEHQF